MAKRIQLSRKKGWRKPEGAVVVARPSKWGNPFKADDAPDGRYVAVALFSGWLHGRGVDPLVPAPSFEDIRRELRGKDLACWCPLDAPCHADVLLDIANGEAPRMTWYHEQRTQLGRWSPVTTPDRPEQRKDGRLGKAGGVGPMIRRVKRVAAEHEGLSLAALQAGYGHDGDGWREPGEGVETAPVFRSGRVAP